VTRRSPTRHPACGVVRESLSARLDDEGAPLTGAAVDRHLDGCHACARYATDLQRVHREARVAVADEVPDLTADILVAITEEQQVTVGRRTRELRLLVALAGAVQLALAVPVLLGLLGPAAHVGRELGALQLALGVGLLVAAWQPWRAAGVLPVAAVVASAAVVAGVVDVASGAATLTGELVHLSEIAGVLALWALRRRDPALTAPAPPLATGAGPTAVPTNGVR
jgi:predicted anti-sigma-YlaC factor YlaD